MISVRNGTTTGGSVTVISVASNAGASFSVPNIYEPSLRRTLDRNRYSEVEVVNVDGAGALYFRIDGADPAVGGEDAHVVPAAVGQALKVPINSSDPEVRVISAVGTDYSVEFR